MKKILCIAALSVLFSMTALADGEMGGGNKTCTSNCLANPDIQVETTKNAETSKSLSEITNDYFGKMVNYFIEVAF